MAEQLLFIIFGAFIAIVSSWLKSLRDRETNISNELFKQRINSLNKIWVTFPEVRDAFGKKIERSHDDCIEECKESAREKLNKFRAEIDKNQVILPAQIIEALRDIDLFLFADVLEQDNYKLNDYISGLSIRLNKLSEITNNSLLEKTHKIDLKFRT